jgi:hypothetical protein
MGTGHPKWDCKDTQIINLPKTLCKTQSPKPTPPIAKIPKNKHQKPHKPVD